MRRAEPHPSGDADAERDPFDAVTGASVTLTPGWLVEADAAAARRAPHARRRRWPRWTQGLGRAARVEDIPPYPLADASFLGDLGEAARNGLEAAFHATAPRALWGSRVAARRHLDQLLPASGYRDWSDLHGLHFILGAAGTGKTTLVLRIAAAARRAGVDAAVLSLLPERPERAAFLDAASLLDLPAVVVARRSDWDAAMGAVAQRHVVLVDTPCFISRPEMPWQLLTLPELRRGTSVLHYVVCLHHRAAFIARQLQLAAAHRIHDLALTKVDLAPGIGALLALQLAGPRRIAFVSTSARLDTPPGLGTSALRNACGMSAD